MSHDGLTTSPHSTRLLSHTESASMSSLNYHLKCSNLLCRNHLALLYIASEMQLKAEKTSTYSHLNDSVNLNHPFDLITVQLPSCSSSNVTTVQSYILASFASNNGSWTTSPATLFSSRNPPPLSPNNRSFVNQTLDSAIYLNAACASSTLLMPSKEQATTGLMELIKRYPSDTLFFMHSRTRIEDILKSISRAFQCPLEVSPKNLPPLHAPLRSIRCPKRLGTRLELFPIRQIVDDRCSQGRTT
ncbi:hypothetical protein AX14_001965 [Amanita brunnescens Koide BX004]|nr:hypothetical protein AX14_001965 [Amanita brunnescens Koide BX004]